MDQSFLDDAKAQRANASLLHGSGRKIEISALLSMWKLVVITIKDHLEE